jgi:hypothetical protein
MIRTLPVALAAGSIALLVMASAGLAVDAYTVSGAALCAAGVHAMAFASRTRHAQ